MVLLGCKSSKLKHVVCHRRQVFMIPKDNTADLNLTFSFKVDNFSYIVFATSERMKCFGCGEEGHVVRSCPQAKERPGSARTAEPAGSAGGAGRADRPPERAAVRPAGGSVSPDVPRPVVEPDELSANQSAEKEQESEADTQDREQVVTLLQDTSESEVSDDRKVQTRENSEDQKQAEETGPSVEHELMAENTCEEKAPQNKSQKRKNSGDKEQSSAKNKKPQEEVSDDECEWTPSQEDEMTLYPLEKITRFLSQTKGQRAVKTEQFFPDLRGFVRSVAELRKDEDSFSDQEIYRLRKIVTKVKAQLIDDDDVE